MTAACTSSRPQGGAVQPELAVSVLGQEASYMPRAKVYRTNGDFAKQVPVRMNAGRTELISYPAPTDIRSGNAPVPMADGWLLDRTGVDFNTVFTRYGREEFAGLREAPSSAELVDAVIAGSGVTEIAELPFTLSQAQADTAECNRLIREGLPGCRVLGNDAVKPVIRP